MTSTASARLSFVLLCALGWTSLTNAATPTTGVYDENVQQANTVDFTATGSGISFEAFQAAMPGAFADGRGGVINCSIYPADQSFS